MGRRGRKRQLDLESEYWKLLQTGVGTVAARAASTSSSRHLSCVDAARDEPRRGLNMAVLSNASNRQVTLTWAEGRC